MVERVIKSNRWECDKVKNNHLRFLIRQGNYKVGDVFHMQCYEKGKPVLHITNKKAWVITLVMDHTLLPVEKNYKVLAFREL